MSIIERELNNIKVKVAAMSVAADEMYQDAVTALSGHDAHLAAAVVRRDHLVDALELDIDEMCLKVLALHAPKAMDLRYVVAVLRLIIELERVADHSKVIARQVFNYHCASLLPALPDFNAIVELSQKMLRETMATFFEKNDRRYDVIIETDKEVGRLQKKLNHSLVALIKQDSSNVDGAIALINVVRRLERIGDHAKNIAELVPYIFSGKIVRHKDGTLNADSNN
jgi:phosphate transport system protein